MKTELIVSSRTRRLPAALMGGALALVTTAGDALEVELSGQVNRALMNGDNGVLSETLHVDNNISSTRFRFEGVQEDAVLDANAGVVFEAEFQSNPSNVVSLENRSVDAELNERHMYVFFEDAFGIVSLGQGDGAANGGTEVDLSGTAIAQNSLGVNTVGAGIRFAEAGAVTDVTIGNVISNQDFESRYDRLLYEAPEFGPLRLVLSTGVSGNFDVNEAALWYSQELAALGELAAAVGFSSQDRAAGEVDDETVGGSVSWLSPAGLVVTLAYSQKDLTADREGTFNYVKLGYQTGRHAVAVDFARGEDQAEADEEADMVGVGYVYHPADWAQVYAAAKELSLDRPGRAFEDIQIIMIGSRLQF